MATIDDQAASWMVRRASRELSEAERHEFEAWYEADIRHKGAYLRAVAVDHALGRATAQPNLRPRHATGEITRRWPRKMLAALGGIAAGIVVAAGVLLAQGQAPVAGLMTAKGEMRRFPLADHSIASLNSGSEVEVAFTATTRQVRLKRGEAWFEVAKDRHKPFIVEAGAIRVKAVGTAFSVRRQGAGAEVLVTEGVVEAWSTRGGPHRILLSRGEQAYVPEHAAAVATARQPDEVERKLAWRKGRVVFVNQTLGEAVADFNRYSHRRIVIADPALAHLAFVGQYAVDAPEVFAKDVSAYLGVPLLITADMIQIGKARPRQENTARPGSQAQD